MSVTPPSGFGIYARTANPNGGSRNAVNTFGFKNNGGFNAATAMSTLTSALSGTSRPYNASVLNDDWTQTQTYCLLNTAGVLSSASAAFSIPGTLTTPSPPAGTSIVVRKGTALAGRQYRGRVAYFPCAFDEASVSAAGIISAGVLSTYQAFWTAALTACATASVPLYLIHGPDKLGVTPVPTAITAMTIDNLVGSQRRRLRR